MHQLGQYVLSLTASAIICGIVLSFFREGSIRKLLRLICSVILTIIALSPLADFSITEFASYSEEYISDGQDYAAIGTALADVEKRKRIQEQFEAYILDKADILGTEITPVVEVDELGIPIHIKLCGECSADARQILTEIITNDLGVPEEEQKWTGEM